MENIGARVKALRMAQGWSQTEAARRLGISQPSLADIENGVTKSLAGKTLAKMCQTFHTTAEYLMFGTGADDMDAELPLIEAEVLFMLRSMSSERRHFLLDSARGMFNAQQQASKNNPYPNSIAPGVTSAPQSVRNPKVLRGIVGPVEMIGEVSPAKGDSRGEGDRNPRVPGKKHPGLP